MRVRIRQGLTSVSLGYSVALSTLPGQTCVPGRGAAAFPPFGLVFTIPPAPLRPCQHMPPDQLTHFAARSLAACIHLGLRCWLLHAPQPGSADGSCGFGDGGQACVGRRGARSGAC